ncbi:MAG: ATP-binding protein [Desulfobacteraceae bacterium]|jgi:PAS domain S-box-containing protein
MTVSYFPIWAVDIFGAVAMIILAFFCLNLSLKLRQRDPTNIIWTYLLWVCMALAVFAVSRSLGHILKQFLILSENSGTWRTIAPFSGAVNTFTFIVVGAVTLYFQRTWSIYQQMAKDKQELKTARNELIYLNHNLESAILERTKALAISEAKYRQIFEVSKDMILVTTWDGLIINLNPTGSTMLGLLQQKDLVKKQYFQKYLITPKTWDAIVQKIEKDGFIGSEEIQLRLSNGNYHRALLSGSLVGGGDDQKDTLHFWVKDIEQRYLMIEHIAQADKLVSIGELSAGIAHEINNPLGVILGYTQLLIRNEIDTSERYQDLKTIEKHTRHCKSIVEDLLKFSRTSKPKKALNNIHEIIDDVLNFVKYQSNLDQVEITKDYDVDIMPVLLDEKKIKQVFINLIMNAKHAVGKTGSIVVKTCFQANQNAIAICISDNGYGIIKKNLSQIFDPFFTTKPTGEGTGLGLSVSYGIIKNHGGHISVESTPGKGSTFTVVLPAAVHASTTLNSP